MKKTKRILLIFMVAAILSGSIVPLTVSADSTAAGTVEYWYNEDFSTMTTIPTAWADICNNGGIAPLDGYKPDATASNSNLANGALNLVYSKNNGSYSKAMFDLQFWGIGAWGNKITGDFTLSMDIKPIGAAWNRSNTDFMQFRKTNSGDFISLFSTNNNAIVMTTDEGSATSQALSTTEYTTVELMFDMENDDYTTLECYINGVKLGTKNVSEYDLPALGQFRMFMTYTEGQGMSIDRLSLVKSCTSLYVEDPVVAMFDFSKKANTSSAVADVKASGGLWVKPDGNHFTQPFETLKYTDKPSGIFLDLQMFNIASYNVKEDMLLSFKFKPEAANMTIPGLITWRDNGAESDFQSGVRLSEGKIRFNSTNYTELPINEWALIEIAYHYDTANEKYDTCTVIVNGETVGNSITMTSGILAIDQFRLFDNTTGTASFSVDDICIVKGSETRHETPEAAKARTAIVSYDFASTVNTSSAVADVKASGGLWVKPDGNYFTQPSETLKYTDKQSGAFLDLQMFNIDTYDVNEDLILSFKFKPEAANMTIPGLITWRDNGAESDFQSGVRLSEGKIRFNSTNYTELLVNEWALIELVYHYDTTDQKYDTCTVIVNGKTVGDPITMTSGILAIDQFRLFNDTTGTASFSIDDLGLYIYDNSAPSTPDDNTPSTPGDNTPTVPTLPTRPNVADSAKTNMKYYYHNDFSANTINTINSPASAIVEAGGLWLSTEGSANAAESYSLTDGTLVANGFAYLDLQFFRLDDYRVKEDFIISFDFKPTSAGLTTEHFVDWRVSDAVNVWDNKRIGLDHGDLIVDEKNCGKLPVNEWTLIEIAFGYNDTLREFDTFKVLINGTVVAEGEVRTDAVLTLVEHFRMFRYIRDNDGTFAVDNLNIISGSTSMVYATGFSEDQLASNMNNNNGNNNENNTPNTPDGSGDDGSGDNNKNEETTAPSADTTAPDKNETTEKSKEEGGCGSSMVGAGAIAIVACGIAMSVCVRKKKD